MTNVPQYLYVCMNSAEHKALTWEIRSQEELDNLINELDQPLGWWADFLLVNGKMVKEEAIKHFSEMSTLGRRGSTYYFIMSTSCMEKFHETLKTMLI